jgi:hypothetical protein
MGVKSWRARSVQVMAALGLTGAVMGCGSHLGQNSGTFTFGVVGRVSNAAGTCVVTSYRGPYSKNGTLCTGTRLGVTGQCVSFSVSNINAAHSDEPSVGRITVLDEANCSAAGR